MSDAEVMNTAIIAVLYLLLSQSRNSGAGIRPAPLFLGFICLFLRWEGSKWKLKKKREYRPCSGRYSLFFNYAELPNSPKQAKY